MCSMDRYVSVNKNGPQGPVLVLRRIGTYCASGSGVMSVAESSADPVVDPVDGPVVVEGESVVDGAVAGGVSGTEGAVSAADGACVTGASTVPVLSATSSFSSFPHALNIPAEATIENRTA